MINPHHECSWTYRRLTETALTGSGLSGGGVSLDVLLHAFVGRELSWHSTIYGDHDDNILMVAVDPETAASLEKLPSARPMIGPTAESQSLEEYALSDQVAADLGGAVPWEPGASSFLTRILKRRPSCEISTQGGLARWIGGGGSGG
jgi:hypothetical protein